MRTTLNVAGLLLLAATAGAQLPSASPGRGAVAIAVRMRAPIRFITNRPEQVTFVKLVDGDDPYRRGRIIHSGIRKGDYVYLLNAEPGRYAAVATFTGGGARRYTTMLVDSARRATVVNVQAGTIAFMGDLVVNQSIGLVETDSIMTYLAAFVGSGQADRGTVAPCSCRDLLYRGALHEFRRDSADESRFLTAARADLGAGWTSVIDRRVAELTVGKRLGTVAAVTEDTVTPRTDTLEGALTPAGLRPAAAQAPAGYVTYDSLASEFTIAMPQGWWAYNQGAAMREKGLRVPNDEDVVFFTAINLWAVDNGDLSGQKRSRQQVDDIHHRLYTGEIPEFFVQFLLNERGMSCAGLTDEGARKVFDLVHDTDFGHDRKVTEALRSDSAMVGGCHGIHLQGRVQTRDGSERVIDLYAVSNGAALYTFALDCDAAFYKANAAPFETAISTLRLTVADSIKR